MQKKNKSILNVLNLEVLPVTLLPSTIISATRKMFDKEGNVPPVLLIAGSHKDGQNYCYTFNLISHPDLIESPITFDENKCIHDIIEDTKEEFVSIDLIVYQTIGKVYLGTIGQNETIDDAILREKKVPDSEKPIGVILMIETPTSKYKEIIFKINNTTHLASEFNKDLLSVVGDTQDFGLYNKEKNMDDIKMKKQTLWDTIGVEKDFFDFIDEILADSKTNKLGLSDTIRKVILKLRENELGKETSNGGKVTSYEMKLFLAGKIFEEKLKKLI